jgi:hypothetical protein
MPLRAGSKADFCAGSTTRSHAAMTRLPLVVHERLGTWARQLRPRVVGWPVRLVESRSAADLKSAVARSACPLVVLDLGDRVRSALDELDLALQVAPNSLVVVLDRGAQAGVADLAREMGAAHVFSGVVPPPAVADLLSRWLPLALRRAQLDGWSPDREPDPELDPADPLFSFAGAFGAVARP